MLRFFVCVYVLLIATDATRAESRTPPKGMTLHKTSMLWEDAERTCHREGAVLASPTNDKALEAMKSLMGAKKAFYFIGIKSHYFTGPFVSVEAYCSSLLDVGLSQPTVQIESKEIRGLWTTNTTVGVPLENMTLSMMDMIDTIDQLKGDCLAMNIDSIQAVPCWWRLPFMCYNANNLKEFLPCGPIDKGYKYNEKQMNCYKMHREESNWEQAEQTCVNEGGHLVVIDNMKEARTVMKILTDSVITATWTGNRDHTGNGDWITVHGDRVEDLFNTWWSGTKPHDKKFCGRFHDTVLGWWQCTQTQPFICEKFPNIY